MTDEKHQKLETNYFKTQNRVRYTNVQAKNFQQNRTLNSSNRNLDKARRQSMTSMDKERTELKNQLTSMSFERRRQTVNDLTFKLSEINMYENEQQLTRPAPSPILEESAPIAPTASTAPTAPTAPEPTSGSTQTPKSPLVPTETPSITTAQTGRPSMIASIGPPSTTSPIGASTLKTPTEPRPSITAPIGPPLMTSPTEPPSTIAPTIHKSKPTGPPEIALAMISKAKSQNISKGPLKLTTENAIEIVSKSNLSDEINSIPPTFLQETTVSQVPVSNLLAYKNYGGPVDLKVNDAQESHTLKSAMRQPPTTRATTLPQVVNGSNLVMYQNSPSYSINDDGITNDHNAQDEFWNQIDNSDSSRATTPFRGQTPGRFERSGSLTPGTPNMNSLSLVRFQGLGTPEAIGSVRRRRKTIEEQARDAMRYRLAASAAPVMRRRASLGAAHTHGSGNLSRPLLGRRGSHSHLQCTIKHVH